MSVNLQEQLRRERLHLCIWCAKPARFLHRHNRHGVHCTRHAAIIARNYKAWVNKNGGRGK